jgi:alpha-N-arabinofuranosidase
MANIAQTINVLQALIFTEGDQMVLTPTYHIYDMYKVHHDATLLPQTLEGPNYVLDLYSLAAISASASMDLEGRIHLSLVNIDPKQAHRMEIELKGKSSAKVTGQLLSSKMMDSHNSFAQPREVVPVAFEGARIKKGKLELTMPAHSVVVLQID